MSYRWVCQLKLYPWGTTRGRRKYPTMKEALEAHTRAHRMRPCCRFPGSFCISAQVTR